MNTRASLIFLLFVLFSGCRTASQFAEMPPIQDLPDPDVKTSLFWQNASIYFLLTDRFHNGNPNNDVNFNRTKPTSTLRGFMGGDIKGVTQKIEAGYFDDLGVNAIWLTPLVEQGHGIVNEGTGGTYGFHGYWAKDWTKLDPNFGTEAELAEMVEAAHKRGIRILLDVVINHTGPVTDQDAVFPEAWVRTDPTCDFKTRKNNVECTLVRNLPDIKTEIDEPVSLPPQLIEKWKAEGRYEREMAELDAFFARTGYPRSPRFYIVKWLTDPIRKYGIDGFRCDTVKHVYEEVWSPLYQEAQLALDEWKRKNPRKVLDNSNFYMVGEVYDYNLYTERLYPFSDYKADFFKHGFMSLINFGFKYDAQNWDYEKMFSQYAQKLQQGMQGKTVVHYASSHDDPRPFDVERKKPIETATKLMLAPGSVQIYYGDETNRTLRVESARGDANLRSFMNWEEIASNTVRNGFATQEVLAHWQKLGRFRKAHLAVGAGTHTMISQSPYIFKRELNTPEVKDAVVVGLDLPKGKKEISVRDVFTDGTTLQDYYSGQKLTVKNGKVEIDSDFTLVLLGK